ncbi:hypothetical protein ACA910_004205 [Epithemia clementina (nom. ined.)]
MDSEATNAIQSRKRDVSSAELDEDQKAGVAQASTKDEDDGQDNVEEDDDEDDEEWDDRKDSNVVAGDELSDFEKEDDERGDDEQVDGPNESSTQIEPSYQKFGSIPFAMLAKRLEQLWQRKFMKKGGASNTSKTNSKPITMQGMLMNLMPPKMLHSYSQHDPGQPPESIYPLLRLLCPEKDGARRTFVKEMTLAKAYIKAFGWSNDKKESRKLLYYTDPAIVGTTGAGDFSVVLQHVLQGEDPNFSRVSKEPSKVSLTQINQALDELGALGDKQSRKTNHDWRPSAAKAAAAASAGTNSGQTNKARAKPPKLGDLRANWVRRFLNVGDLRLSPLEHKWLARILMERMQFGIGFDKLLTWYNPLGPAMWSGHNSLKAVCNALCQPAVANKIKMAAQAQVNAEAKNLTVAPYMTMSASSVQLGKNFVPMFSQRTSFQRIMTEISGRHREYLKNPDYGQLGEGGQRSAALKSLAMKHPVFSIETKLDGERMLVHYHRLGKLIKIHSRQGVWFSNIYSPVLGPAIRRAVEEWDLDLILDGEVLAWDNAKKETVPFGNNRTVAKLRRQWMSSQRLLDVRDKNVHLTDSDIREFPMSMDFAHKDELFPDLAGRDCWLQYIVFDVLYVGGPKAREFLATTISPYLNPEPGSIVGLDGLERKKILYRLINRQVNEVEIVLTTVVRPDGKSADGSSYFSFDDPITEMGYPAHALDSITGAFHGHIPNLAQIDAERRGNLSDEEISQARADLMNEHYSYIVENLFLEGLLFKDLSTPYVLDKVSRLLSYWRKFKPDYFNGAAASDLDLVVIGAYFATGLRNSGQPSSFLCACIDSNDDNLFYPFCKVNGGSMDSKDLSSFLGKTEFKAAASESALDYGRWFRIESIDSLPPFVTSHSNVGDGKPWRPSKKDIPDLWIDPRNSAVVTLNAGEIVFSSAFPVGVTLRFPRITRLRLDKDPDEIETDTSIWDLYNKVEAERAQGSNSFTPLAGAASPKAKFRRFLTESQYAKYKKNTIKRPQTRAHLSVAIASNPIQLKSSAFKGLSFCVLNGNYALESSGVSRPGETMEEDWVASASHVKSKLDVELFIKEHGGKVLVSPDDESFVLGGRKTDISVQLHVQGIESARNQAKPTGKKPTQKSLKFQKMAVRNGVLLWTFPFSLIAKWNARSAEGTIKTAAPDLLSTNTLDYLAQPASQNTPMQLRSLGKMQSTMMMRRALEFAGETMASGTGTFVALSGGSQNIGWYSAALNTLKRKDIWVLDSGPHHDVPPPMWPNPGEDHTALRARELVVYPDVFPSGACNDSAEIDRDPWKRVLPKSEHILSVIPLLRVYGATIATHLGSNVTHIVFDLPAGISHINPCNRNTEHKYVDVPELLSRSERGREILRRLDALETKDIWIVSPTWIRHACRQRWGC